MNIIANIKVLPIRMLMYFLWLFDWTAFNPKPAFFVLVLVAVGILASFSAGPVFSKTKETSNYFSRGIIAYAYGSKSALNSSNVLGAKTKRDLPAKTTKIDPPFISAKSALIVDVNSEKTLYSINSSTRFAPASTTKLMTALVALNLYSATEVISIPEVCTKVESSKLDLPATEKFKVLDLLYGMLIQSAGDAACTLASTRLPYNEFVSLMNSKAKNIGMDNSQFTNPIGLDGANYSTAQDLYKLAKTAVTNPIISKIVRTQKYEFTSYDEKYPFVAYTTNKLLAEIPNSVGIKTGTTAEAGEVLIYEYKKDKVDLIIIIMGSSDRFTDTKNLLNWILASYTWE